MGHAPAPRLSRRARPDRERSGRGRSPGGPAAGLVGGRLEAGAVIVERAVREWQLPCEVTVTAPGILRVRYRHSRTPKVSILVPTRDRVDLLRPCIEGMLTRTRYPNFEVLVLDNGSSEPGTREFLAQAGSDPRFRSMACAGVFNWARINNLGAAATDGEVLLLLNNDTAVIHDDWLDELVSQVLRPEVGIVGAKLIYPDDHVQHAGIEIDPAGNASHTWRGAPRHDPGYLDQLRIVRTVSAVTGACMALRRSTFDELGGLDETLRVAWNDVDLCLRARRAGYRVLWTPYAELYHHEGATRTFDTSPQDYARALREQGQVRSDYGDLLTTAGLQSPNLTTDRSRPYLSTRAGYQRDFASSA